MLSFFPYPSIQVNRGFLITGTGKSESSLETAGFSQLTHVKNGIPPPEAILTPPLLFYKPQFATSDKIHSALCGFFSYFSFIQGRLSQSYISWAPDFPDLLLVHLASRQGNKKYKLQIGKHGVI